MGSCQNYGPFLGTLNNGCRIIIGTQKGTRILTTTHMSRGVTGVGRDGFERLGFRASGPEVHVIVAFQSEATRAPSHGLGFRV